MGSSTLVTLDIDDQGRIEAIREDIRKELGPFHETVGIDSHGNLAIALSGDRQEYAEELLEDNLIDGDRACVVEYIDGAVIGFATVYRLGEGELVEESYYEGAEGEEGRDVADAVENDYGFRPLVDHSELDEILKERYGEKYARADKLLYWSQKLLESDDNEESNSDAEFMIQVTAEDYFEENEEVQQAVEEGDWKKTERIARKLISRPYVSYE